MLLLRGWVCLQPATTAGVLCLDAPVVVGSTSYNNMEEEQQRIRIQSGGDHTRWEKWEGYQFLYHL